MKKAFSYKSIPNMTVGMQSQEDRNLQVLHGKVLLNEEESRLLFMQNSPRGPRSQEVMRTAHSRLVRTPQGNYTLTFRFSRLESIFASKLIEEMVKVCNTITNVVDDNEQEETL